ncbi:MAG: DUF1015 domain-containing protein [Candidatus Omnitrophica bacterium]|nr:DUF1015 domain-containing protein [Candidatus Omnitrophota bacterium]MCF7894750.1 DUF1015 domain-containing protein [Candidatus Omnitrophota bacterium]
MGQTTKPFKATHYNLNLLDDFSKVACPPYDVIDKKRALNLKKRSPYNYCRINLADGKNYNKPARNLQKWLKEKVLVDDQKKNYYLYQQEFIIGKNKFLRYGILCLLNMKKKKIFPHEHTLDKPKKDRKKMITKLKANLSPVFVIAGNTDKTLRAISEKYIKKKPFIEFKDDENNLNSLWKIGKKEDIEKISSSLEASYLIIADGHHRFETSFDYFKKNKNKFKNLSYILAYLTIPQPGLVILPIHRITPASTKNKEYFNKIKNRCKLEQVSQKNLEKKLKIAKNFCFGVYWNKKFYFATLQKEGLLDTISPAIYKKLNTYIFHNYVLPEIKCNQFAYNHSIDEVKKVTKKNQMAFIMKAVSLKAVFDIAKAGYRLPQKSTFFYPKVFSGLVLRRFRR